MNENTPAQHVNQPILAPSDTLTPEAELRQVLEQKRGFICDMDGVLYHGNKLLPGVVEFVEWLKVKGKKFLFLTNSSERTPRELREKMLRLGVEVNEDAFYTSALATAAFLQSQARRKSAYVIGEAGLINALYEKGFSINDVNPEYVVIGEAKHYTYDSITKAVNLVLGGAKLIGTNPDLTGPVENGIVPATKALMAPIELSTGKLAYYIGKPNPLIMRHALKKLGCNREESIIIGDRMDTDIVAGIESEIDTLLVLTGVTTRAEIERFPYRPRYVSEGVGALVKSL